jgi:hypothetical protein
MSAFDNISVVKKATLAWVTVNQGLQASQAEGLVIESALFAVCASSGDK